jgi:putative transposase
MARLPRLWIPGAPQHLVVRGNNRQAIFRSDGDRIMFHRCLVETSRRFGVEVHAYVLMTNHVHLLATAPASGAISSVFQALGRRYVSYFNYLHGRSGTLWEGRFRACIVQTERYLLMCQRYIELNPVRAGVTPKPEDFPWSSHRFYARGLPDDVVTPHPVFVGLAAGEEARRTLYGSFLSCDVASSEIEQIRQALNKGWPLGTEEFRKHLETMSGRRLGPQRRGPAPARRELDRSDSDPNYRSRPQLA